MAETLQGGPEDAPLNQAISKLIIVPITEQLARGAADLKRKSGMTGVKHTIDALVVAVSVNAGGGIILTSDPGDINRLSDGAPQVKIRAVDV
jgi:hypothetical protein